MFLILKSLLENIEDKVVLLKNLFSQSLQITEHVG